MQKINSKSPENLEIRKQMAKTMNPELKETGTKWLGLVLCLHCNFVFNCNDLEIYDDDDLYQIPSNILWHFQYFENTYCLCKDFFFLGHLALNTWGSDPCQLILKFSWPKFLFPMPAVWTGAPAAGFQTAPAKIFFVKNSHKNIKSVKPFVPVGALYLLFLLPPLST